MSGYAEVDDVRASKRLKSGPSVNMVLVTFANTTERNVDVAWLDYKGEQFKIRTLEPLQRVDVNTWVHVLRGLSRRKGLWP